MPSIAQPTDNESADSTQAGTVAVTGNTDTSHGATTCAVSIGAEESNVERKSCRWFTFTGPGPRTISLQFTWSISGAGLTLTGALPGTTQANALFKVEYTVDGGSNWSTALSRSFSRDVNGNTAISDSGSENVTLPVAALSLIAVRDRIEADATSAADPTVSASAEIIATISSIQLSIEPQPQQVILMM